MRHGHLRGRLSRLLRREVVVRGDEESGEFIAFWLRDGMLTAAMNVNVWDVNDDLRALLGRSIPAHRVSDPGISLADL